MEPPLTIQDQLVAVTIGLVTLIGILAVIARVPLIYNVRNLMVRWRITLLTAMAFMMVVGLLVVMLAFVNGMYRLTESSGRPDNLIILGQGTQDEVFSSLGFTDVDSIETVAGIARDSENRPLVSKETYVIVNQPVVAPQKGRPRRRFLQMRGVQIPEISGEVHDVNLQGDWFSQAGVRQAAETDKDQSTLIEAVLGEGIARTLGSDRTPEQVANAKNRDRLDVGDEFTCGDRRWIVVGIMKSMGKSFDSEIWAKRELVGRMFGKETYTTMVVRGENRAEAARLVNYFGSEWGKASLQPMLETTYFNNLNGTNQQFLIAIIIVAVIMSIGGVFGVMNTMFAAISQRIKDIGVMRLLGFDRSQILISFLLESMLLAVVGGGIGCLLGSLSDGWTANSIVGSGQGGGKSVVLRVTVDWAIIMYGMLFSLIMGAIGGLLPALSAMRLKLLETLR